MGFRQPGDYGRRGEPGLDAADAAAAEEAAKVGREKNSNVDNDAARAGNIAALVGQAAAGGGAQ